MIHGQQCGCQLHLHPLLQLLLQLCLMLSQQQRGTGPRLTTSYIVKAPSLQWQRWQQQQGTMVLQTLWLQQVLPGQTLIVCCRSYLRPFSSSSSSQRYTVAAASRGLAALQQTLKAALLKDVQQCRACSSQQ
jgi:hypothetical protein